MQNGPSQNELPPLPRRRFNWKAALSTALFLALVALLAWYVAQNWDDMKRLTELSPGTVALLLGLAALGCVMNSLYHLAILLTYKLKLTLTDWMGVVCVSNAIAHVIPMRGDLLFTAAYYKRAKGLAYTRSVSMAAGNIVFGVAFSLLEILAALLCMGLIDGQWPPLMWLLLLAGALCLGAFAALSLLMERRGHVPKNKRVADILTGFNALLRDKTLLLRLLLCLTGGNLIRLLLYMVCFQAAGLPVTFYQALFYTSVSWLSGIVAIVPGNVGIRESLMGAATLLLGDVFATGVAASLLERVAMMAAYFIFALFFAVPVWRRGFSAKETSK